LYYKVTSVIVSNHQDVQEPDNPSLAEPRELFEYLAMQAFP
jgi:hypothetical protein